tara:strand:- start:1725 stop:1895 length:171 start_codon:yes stop_codon:yes gene_type:complete
MRITDKQISEFAQSNDITPLFHGYFEDAGGNMIHEYDIENMIREGKAMWPDMEFPK